MQNLIPPQIRAIFFDAVGTLIHPDPAAGVVYAEVGRRFGSRYQAADIASRFAGAFQREEEADRHNQLRTSEEREIRRWRHIVSQVLDDVTDPKTCFQELYRHFSLPQAWRIDPEGARALEYLAGKGYILGMASNYDRRLREVTAGLPELTCLQQLVISSEVGWRKPAAEFFAALCRQVDLPAGQVLYIGDDPVNDYQGALAAGLQSVLFDPKGNWPKLTVPRLGNFLELTKVCP